MSNPRGPIVVVAGMIEREGKLLISQRLRDADYGLYWEFPGGKLEPGESPEQALERELYEELGIRTRTGAIDCVIRHETPEKDVLLLFYHSRILEGQPRAIEAETVRWVAVRELKDYRFPEADGQLIRWLMNRETDS